MTKLDDRLFAAIESGSLSDVNAALNAGATLDARNDSGETALHVAAGKGNIEVVQALLDRGADPKARLSGGNPNAKGRTPLHQAAFAGSAPVIALLLERGADPFVQDVHNLTPVSCAEMRGKRAAATIRKAIAQSTWANNLTIHSAVRAGLIDRVRALLDGGTPVDALDDSGRTPLHHNEAVISWLVDVEKTNPFMVAGCALDFVDGRFTAEIKEAESLAEQMITFCPDVADQDPSLGLLPRDQQIVRLARDLETTRTFALWWD